MHLLKIGKARTFCGPCNITVVEAGAAASRNPESVAVRAVVAAAIAVAAAASPVASAAVSSLPAGQDYPAGPRLALPGR